MSMSTVSNKPREHLRAWIEGLAPYQSLALLAVPVCLIEPLKLVAVAIAGEGHWTTGTLVIAAAYAGSLFLVERLFIIVKPKLLKLRWFARLWARIIVCRYFSRHCFRSQWGAPSGAKPHVSRDRAALGGWRSRRSASAAYSLAMRSSSFRVPGVVESAACSRHSNSSKR